MGLTKIAINQTISLKASSFFEQLPENIKDRYPINLENVTLRKTAVMERPDHLREVFSEFGVVRIQGFLDVNVEIAAFRTELSQAIRALLNVMSHTTVTSWVPLTDVTREMGALCLIPGSHAHHLRVQLREKPALDGASSFQAAHIADFSPEELDEICIQMPVAAGDALFFHEFMLHRSGHNVADRARWVCSCRYGKLLDESLVARGWQIERSKDFSTLNQVIDGSVIDE